MRRKASRNGKRALDFLKCRVVTFFVFIFVEVGLLNCALTAIQFQPELETILERRFERGASLRLNRGLQLDLEIALNGVSANVQPCGLFCRAEDELKRRMT